MTTLSDRLRFIREGKYGKRGMAEFAKAIGISPSGYLNYERGRRAIPSDVLIKIAQCTSVNLHWLLTGEDLPYPNQEITNRVISKIKETMGDLLAETSDSSQSSSEEIISPFQTTSTLVNSLPLSKPDQNLLLSIIGQQCTRLSSFRSILHPDVVKGFDRSIEAESAGGIQNIPQLVRHCLMRATLGTTAAILVPEIILYLAKDKNDILLAWEYVRSIPDALINDKLTAYYSVMDRFLERGKTAEAIQVVEEALGVVNKLDNSFERMRRLLTIVRCYARCGEMGEAQRILEKTSKMLKTDLASQSLIAKFYRQLAEAESELGRLDRTKQLLNKSLEFGMEKLTDSGSLNTHLSRCAAQYAYLSLKFVGHHNFGEAEKAMTQAEQLVKQIKDPFHQVISLLEAIRTPYVYLNNPAQASVVFLRAIDIAKSISDPTKHSMSLSRIVESCVYDDEFRLAESLANEISHPMEKSSALLTMAFAHLNRNNQEKAKSFLNQAIGLVEKSRDIQGMTDILYRVAMRLLQNREIHMALKLAQHTLSKENKVILLLRFIQTLIKQSDSRSASQELERLIEIAQQISIAKGKLAALVQIAIVYWLIGDKEKANSFISEAKGLLPEVDRPEDKISALLELAEFYIKSSDNRKARQFITESETLARSMHHRSDALPDVACAWARASHPNKTLELINQDVKDPALKTRAIAQLAIAFSQSGDLKNALRLRPQVKDPINKTILHAQIAVGLAESGEINKAKEMINEAIQTSSHINMPSNKAKVYASIAQALAKIGAQDQALRYLQKALQNASCSTREIALEVIGELIPVISSLGGAQLLSDVYPELQRADEIFND